MSEPERPPQTAERAEGDPPDDESAGGRTPHPTQPAEGEDPDAGPADST